MPAEKRRKIATVDPVSLTATSKLGLITVSKLTIRNSAKNELKVTPDSLCSSVANFVRP